MYPQYTLVRFRPAALTWCAWCSRGLLGDEGDWAYQRNVQGLGPEFCSPKCAYEAHKAACETEKR